MNGAMIFVKDLPRMAAFYETTLGLKPIFETRMDSWLDFDAGGFGFSLHTIPHEIANDIEITSPPQPREKVPVKLIFEVEDLTAECQRLESLGVPIRQRPGETCDGIDPEGNIFQLRRMKTKS